ncbi:uncharacterized protein BDV17DRAFT_258848 [Aspergillus undulatus]|uniref:uncharacterized protein n=1 Tax=Aspergillus undulatus TaxID=1810928 RepID=UPI003CCE2B16
MANLTANPGTSLPPPPPLTATYKTINSSTITTDIYLPSSPPPSYSPNGAYPVLITIHGGAFMLGHSRLISLLQVSDCLNRGWIVLSPNHRLCPGVDVRSGPMEDVRDLLGWVYSDAEQDGLDGFLAEKGSGGDKGRKYRVDKERVMAMGTSSGGFLALALGYDTPRPPAAILNFYGAVHFTHPSWRLPLPHVSANLPAGGFDKDFLNKVYDEYPVPTASGISLEGDKQPSNKPDFTRPRDAFAISQIANGTVLDAIFPNSCGNVDEIDPVFMIEENFPPTFIVHGDCDRMVSVEVSRKLYEVLREKGVRSGMVEIEGEDHTFALGMSVGGKTWNESKKGFEWLEGAMRGV